MALIQSSRPATGGGGGGIAIRGWQVDLHTQTANFTAGLLISLTQNPVSAEAIAVDCNGQKLVYGVEWDYVSGGNDIEIMFSDPYVTDYDEPPVFQIQYPYL